MKPLISIKLQCTIILILFSFSFASLAKSTDKEAPLHIEADQLEMHEKENFSIYTGNVKINKGSLKITGDKIIIRTHNKALHSININGKPATFFQLNDLDEAINAESNKMDYLAPSGILELKENAKLIKNKNHFSSQHIIYNTLQDIVKAGGEDTPESKQKPRVKITIYPEDKSASKQEKLEL